MRSLLQGRRGRGPRQDSPSLYQLNRARLEALAHQAESYDAAGVSEYTAAKGWHLDNYQQALPSERPGPPEPHGSFAAAQQVLRNYSFPPPLIITGVYNPEADLNGRVMALRGRFLFFTFWFGVRVNQVVDEVRPVSPDNPSAEQEAVWGYSYRTLQGHFEEGQIDFTLHKRLSSGKVTMKINAISKTAHIRNPLYRLGFRLFGRQLQMYFARASLRRTQKQVQEMLRTGRNWPPPQEKLERLSAADVPENLPGNVQGEGG